MNETTWEYVVQDFSPLLTYAGYTGSNIDPSILNPAWQQSCPEGGSAGLGGLTVCDLASSHTTTLPGASVSLTFYGES